MGGRAYTLLTTLRCVKNASMSAPCRRNRPASR
jgi:hypothetical protein